MDMGMEIGGEKQILRLRSNHSQANDLTALRMTALKTWSGKRMLIVSHPFAKSAKGWGRL
jgi:hypothetical protein